MKNQHPKTISTTTTITIVIIIIIGVTYTLFENNKKEASLEPIEHGFDGKRALQSIEYQLSLGPRTPGSHGHKMVINWLENSLNTLNWETTIQEGEVIAHKIQNIIAKKGAGKPWIILGAHYDSRILADHDSSEENRSLPVPGANDGASGVAVLLELARVLPEDFPGEVWIVFFDAEDNGDIPGWDWILGSKYFVHQMIGRPDAVVIVDMIGDSDLNIYKERISNQQLTTQIWEIAAALGYEEYFIPEIKYNILDDHIPFVQLGIAAIDIIDFDYPYWHTTEDTYDKVSEDSLIIVGETLLAWLHSFYE